MNPIPTMEFQNDEDTNISASDSQLQIIDGSYEAGAGGQRPLTRSQTDIDKNKHLRMLKFANPGKFMEDFDPERSSREMRKMNRRIYRDTSRKGAYDDQGRLWSDGRDICDCLDEECPGCHFPCSKCDSEKCGADCRCNRRWFYQEIEIEGANQKIMFPGIDFVLSREATRPRLKKSFSNSKT